VEAVLGAGLLVVGAIAAGLGLAVQRLRREQRELRTSVELVEALFDAHDARLPIRPELAEVPHIGLPIGAPAPLPLGISNGLATVLVFVSDNCGPCRELLTRAAGWAERHRGNVAISFLVRGFEDDNRKLVAAFPDLALQFQGDTGIADAYRAAWTPGAVVIAGNGRVASPLAFGPEAIEELVQWAADNATLLLTSHVVEPTGMRAGAELLPGDRVPAFVGNVANGDVLPSEQLTEDTLLVFWQQGCPFCDGLAPDLLAVEQLRPDGVPSMVLVSREMPEQGFASTVLLDAGEIMDSFGRPGTPSAMLLGADGRIASTMASGGPDVRALMGIPEGFGGGIQTPVAPPTRRPVGAAADNGPA
jgi:thiol-disulfide isomerase/thioredoxin